MAVQRIGMAAMFLGVGIAAAAAAWYVYRPCYAPEVTFSTRNRCFALRASDLARGVPLNGCVGRRATYRAAGWQGDEPAWESLECLSQAEREDFEERLDAYLEAAGFSAFESGIAWSRPDRHVRLKQRGVLGAPTSVTVRIEELVAGEPGAP